MRLSALSCLAAALLCAGAVRAEDAPAAPKLLEWHFVYYMAYDNNLEKCGPPILDMLGKGVTSDDVVVTCLSDYTDREGLKRHVFTKGGHDVQKVDGEGIAEEETLRDHLAWASTAHPAKRYAIVFLDHGGRLGQMSNDANPGKAGGQDWLEVVETGQTIATWRRGLPAAQKVELCFLQQCGKGTLENYHAFKDAAEFLMGSQYTVGAPNYYYTKAIQAVCEQPGVDGAEVARLMRENDPPNMFTTYTTIRSSALQDLVKRLEPVLAPLAAREKVDLARGLKPCFDMAPDEAMFDGFAFLDGLYTANELDKAPLQAFTAWCQESLIVGHRISTKRPDANGTCGFSLFLPLGPQALTRYTHYPLWKDTALHGILEKIYRGLLERQKAARERAQRERAEKQGAKPDAPKPDAPKTDAPDGK